jgi:nitrate reductase gamma subunit
MPVHLRWELYPVAHEKGRPYGGSYLEEVEWWHKPRRTNPFGEFTTFIGEILFFREYFKSKRGFWYFVYPFHIGLFLLLAWVLLIAAGSIMLINGSAVTSPANNAAIEAIYYLTLIAGLTAFVLGIFGTAGLLIKRAGDKDLKIYTNPIDYFNLAVILLIFILGLATWFFEDRTFAVMRGYVQGLFVFKQVIVGHLLTAFLLTASIFLAYMPFTRIMHYVAKYFTYHKVRWDDKPMAKGGRLERQIGVLLDRKAGWAAPHVHQGKTWAEQSAGTGAPDKTDPKQGV